jgi:hypothetical protein
MIVMDEIPHRADMILDLFRERQPFAHQATDALPQRVVEPPTMPFATAVPTTTNPLDMVESPDDVLSSRFENHNEPPVQSDTATDRGYT